ncbi:TonB-dependent receptor domain-containing protein [Sphingopyxis fribergensis]
MSYDRIHRPQARFRRVLLATSLLSTIVLPGAAAAQDVAVDETAAEAPTDIVVTGSRLQRTDLTAPSPITVVGEDTIKLSGNVTLERTLNQFPQLGQGNTGSVNNGGGAGVLTANLRGLGSTRTLTLVNGRRFIPANSAADVDLASIPDTLVRRVDIITGGASAVYGSDAIAGAVNFMLKDDFHGFEATAQYGINELGDGASQKYDLTIGANLPDNRGNVALAFSYTKQEPFTQADRSWARIPVADNAAHTAFVYSGSGNIPGMRIPLSTSQLAGIQGVGAAGSPCTAVTSIRFEPGGAPVRYCSPEDSYNYASYNLLQRPLERFNVSAIGHYDITDNITAFAELYFVNARNNSILAPDSFAPVTPSPTNPLTTTLLVPYVNNPALPAVTAAFFAANPGIFDPDGDGIAAVNQAGLRTEDLGTRRSYYERTSFNATGGLRGNLMIGAHEWKWEAFGQFMRNREDTRALGTVNSARLSLALDAVAGPGGTAVCRAQVNGCVPVNIFGTGGISSAAAAFLTPERISNNIFERKVVGASISGTLFELPGGPVATAFGAEYRSDDYEGNPSPFDRAGDYGAASNRALSGSFNVKEVFGEIRVPILSDMAFADTLALEGAVRYSDYSSVGGVTAYKIGGEYAPVRWVRIRGAYNRAVRAPNVAELYNTVGQGFTGGTDPCDKSQNRSPERLAFCVSQGIAQADIAGFTQSALGLTQQSGGNPNLRPEKTDTYTIGGVISPPFIRGLNITVDYFKVNVQDAIVTPNVSQVLNDCFATLDASNVSCQSVVRGPSGQINYVNTQTLNVGYLKVSGIDAQADYKLGLPDALGIGGEPASLSLQAVASWLFNKTQKTLTNTNPQDCAGYYGAGCSSGTGGFILPDFKLNLNATFASGPISWRWSGRMIGALDVFPGTAAFVNHVPAVWYVDTMLSADVMDELRVFMGVNNVGNRKPPVLGTTFVGDANVDVSLFDVAGRRYFVGATLKF